MAAKLRVAFERAKRILIIIDHCNFHFRISFLVNREDIKKICRSPETDLVYRWKRPAHRSSLAVTGSRDQRSPFCLFPATGQDESWEPFNDRDYAQGRDWAPSL